MKRYKMNYNEAKTEFIKRIKSIASKYSCHQVFSDFVEMSAIAISNRLNFDEKREQKYMDLQSRYSKQEMDIIVSLLGLTVDALSDKFGDFLGEVYMGMDSGNKNTGQFFTPYHVSKLCAKVTFDKEETLRAIEENGYVRLHEPTCGSCGMVIAWADVLKDNDINFQESSLAVVQDIDYRCVYMSYIQLSLIGMPAIVSAGNTLYMETYETLYTPMYMLGLWQYRTNKKYKDVVISEKETPTQTNNNDTVTEIISPTKELQLALF